MKELSKLGVEAVLAGKALPGELMVGESLAKYFARLYLHTKDSRDEQLSQRDAQIAALKADFISLDKQMSVLEQTGIADRDRAQKAEAQIAELAKQEPTTDEANHCALVLEYIGQFESEDIDSDTVDMRFEIDGLDTGSDVSITEYATRSAKVIRGLLNRAAPPAPFVVKGLADAYDDGHGTEWLRKETVYAAIKAAGGSVADIDNTAQQYEALAGWKMVPIEPTAEMYDAGDKQLATKQVWDAMLAAAPKPEGQ